MTVRSIKRDLITAEVLRSVLEYDAETGVFRWKRRLGRSAVNVGNVAGCLHSKGYRVITIDGCIYRAHRLAWLYVQGRWPAALIDHINGDRQDNRFANLREATAAQNQANRKGQTKNLKGVTRSGSKWRAFIRIAGKGYFLGTFPTQEAAHAAYVAKAVEIHGDFARAQ